MATETPTMIPVANPSLRPDPTAAIARVVESGSYIHGPEHDLFEREFAHHLGTRHVVACANGTDAIELALRAVGIGPGDHVLTAANAGGYTTCAAERCGAQAVYGDIDPDTLTLAAEHVYDCDAVVVTHLYGRVADMEGIARQCGTIGVPLIADCAQAHGAAGATDLADASCFSFYPTKNLGCVGDGGAVATDSALVADMIRSLRQYGWAERHHTVHDGGRNSRLDEIQAAVLRDRLPLLDADNTRRRQIALRYHDALNPEHGRMPVTDDDSYVAHLAVVVCDDRNSLRGRLRNAGVGSAVHYPVCDHQQPTSGWNGTLPVSEDACRRVLSLPCYPELTDREVDVVCEALT